MLRYRLDRVFVMTIQPGASEARGQALRQLHRAAGLGQGERVPVGLQHSVQSPVDAALLLGAHRRTTLLPQLLHRDKIPRANDGAHAFQGREGVEIKHSTDIAQSKPSQRICMSSHLPDSLQVGHTPISVRVLVVNDPPAG